MKGKEYSEESGSLGREKSLEFEEITERSAGKHKSREKKGVSEVSRSTSECDGKPVSWAKVDCGERGGVGEGRGSGSIVSGPRQNEGQSVVECVTLITFAFARYEPV